MHNKLAITKCSADCRSEAHRSVVGVKLPVFNFEEAGGYCRSPVKECNKRRGSALKIPQKFAMMIWVRLQWQDSGMLAIRPMYLLHVRSKQLPMRSLLSKLHGVHLKVRQYALRRSRESNAVVEIRSRDNTRRPLVGPSPYPWNTEPPEGCVISSCDQGIVDFGAAMQSS